MQDELYIYYRVEPQAAAVALGEVQAWQAGLREARPALLCRLLRRPPVPGEPQTWMEVYAGLDDDAAACLRAGPPGPRPWQIGERHVEVFEPCAS